MPDVNVLVAGFRTDDDQHGTVKVWLEEALNGPEVVGLSDAVAAGFLRVVTHPQIFAKPTPINQALAQLESLWSADGLIRVVPGRSFPAVFARLCREVEARGNLVADAAHAATAMEAGATWISLDRGFARFPGLSWKVPRAE